MSEYLTYLYVTKGGSNAYNYLLTLEKYSRNGKIDSLTYKTDSNFG